MNFQGHYMFGHFHIFALDKKLSRIYLTDRI